MSSKNRTNEKVFWPPLFRGAIAIFLRHIVSAIYRPLPSTVWQSLVEFYVLIPSAKPSNEVECRIYGGWVKMKVQFQVVRGPKFVSFWDDVRVPCSCQHRSLKLSLSCQIVKRGGFGAPHFRGRLYRRFRTYTLKPHSLAHMWLVLVQFSSASSEGSWRQN